MSILPEQSNLVRGLGLLGLAALLFFVPGLFTASVQVHLGGSFAFEAWGFAVYILQALGLVAAILGGVDVLRGLVLSGEYTARQRQAAKEQVEHLRGPMVRDLDRRAFDEAGVEAFSPAGDGVRVRRRSETLEEAEDEDGLGEELVGEVEPEAMSMGSRLRAMRAKRGDGGPRA